MQKSADDRASRRLRAWARASCARVRESVRAEAREGRARTRQRPLRMEGRSGLLASWPGLVQRGLNITMNTIINRRDAEFAELRNLPVCQHLKRRALHLSNSRLRPFVLRALCASAVRSASA
jgi:hypothetical protein